MALALTDVGCVSAAFEDVLGLARSEHRAGDTIVPGFSVGTTVLSLFAADDPFLGGNAKPGVHHITFATDEPSGFARRAGFSAEDLGQTGLDGASRVALAVDETLGVRTVLTSTTPAVSTPGLIERIDHLGIACCDNVAAIGAFHDKLGYVVESTQTDVEAHLAVESFTSDKYGAVYHNRTPRPVAGLRVTFITVGDCELEFLRPFNPDPITTLDEGPSEQGPRTTSGDKGAIGRYIARRGPGLHHIALKTPDIAAVLGRCADAGLDMIDTAGRPGSRRALIGFVHPHSLGGLLLHFVQRVEL